METIKNIFETGKNTNMDYLKSDTQKNIIIQFNDKWYSKHKI